MRVTPESQYADLCLRLLLDPQHGRYFGSGEDADVQWDVLLRLARANVVLIRIHERLEQLGVPPSEAFADAVAQEGQRICSTIELIAKLGELCSQHGIQFMFTKAFQHYPDMGHDVDLFVLDRSPNIDRLVTESLGASPGKGSFVNKVAGKTSYEFPGYPSPVEIHHARMGHIGEHNIYPRIIIQNRKEVVIGGITTFVPSPEDQLIVQAMQRIYGHLTIRLSDVVRTVATIREAGLEWEYVVRTAKQIGILGGLRCYLSYIDQIHAALFDEPLLAPQVRNELAFDEGGKVQFRGGYYRFPILPVTGRLYARKLLVEVGSKNWESVGKLCLLPAVAWLLWIRSLVRLGARKAVRKQLIRTGAAEQR